MAKSWTSLPRRLRCKDCDPEVMSATAPWATSSLLPVVWQASTDALGLDPFVSDILNTSNVWNDGMSRCGESDCRVVRSQGYLARPATERRGVARNIACYSTVQDPGIVKAGKPHDSVEHPANDSADRVSFPWRLWLRDKVL
jgi:hypothetical protein